MQAGSDRLSIAEKPNMGKLQAIHYALLPITNPIYILDVYKYLESRLPTLPYDTIMSTLALIGIIPVYSIAIMRAFWRLTLSKMGLLNLRPNPKS